MTMTRCVLRCVAAAALTLAAGLCYGEEASGNIVDEVLLREGNDATGAAGEEVTLQVEVLGPSRPGLLGGKGKRLPVAGQEVVFSFRSEPPNAEFVGPSSVTTDAGGKASCVVRLGPEFGDIYVQALAMSADGNPHIAEFRLTSGVRTFGNGQEGPAGSTLNDPLSVQVLDSNGKPVSGIPVYFTIEGEPKGASVRPAHTVTDEQEQGLASTFLRLPKLKAPESTSRICVTAEVADPDGKYVARAVRFEANALNRTVMLITLLGGLAVFIFGMKQMCDGLQRVAGEKLKWILRMFTQNRFIAITVGAIVTALIQSSSACTVMTVGFVNAGLVTLTQAIGVILGANIGTTVTGQIIAFKLTDLAYPAIAIGLIVMMVVRNRTHKFWGQAILGFGLLFLGMTVMSSTLKPLRHFPSFVAFFQGFDCTPVAGVMPIKSVLYSILIGTAMTVMVQSSSATIGLTIALAGSGLIDFYTAVPIVLGDNIGTTITAILASIGANRAARRTALAHSLFNVFGAAYMIALFYVPAFWGKGRPIFLEVVQDVTNGNVFAESPENIERHVAMAHSIFNVFNVLLFIPLVGPLARICNAIIPRLKEEEKLTYLEPRLLSQPAIALEQAIKELGYMSNLSFEAISDAFACMYQFDPRLEEKLEKREDDIDNLQADITEYLVKLSQHYLGEAESRMLGPLMHAVNDVERIGDHAENIFELAQLKNSKKLDFSGTAMTELKELFGVVLEQFRDVMASIERRETTPADKAVKLEETINRSDKELHDGHVQRLEAGKCNAQAGVIFLDLVANLEKVGDHLTNIAERIRIVINLANQQA